MMLAKVFKSGNSMAIRIPKAIDLKNIKEFDIQVLDNNLILSPKKQKNEWQNFFKALGDFKESLKREKDEIPQSRDYGEVFA